MSSAEHQEPSALDACPLESILCTQELKRRPSRPPDYQIESRALNALSQALSDSPRTILQALAQEILQVLKAGSAGVSLLTEDGKSFYWPAVAGVWKPHVGGGTPRDFGPCGDVLDRGAPLLFQNPERRYGYLAAVAPPIIECLLVPFYLGKKPIGTVWAISHDSERRFDEEDLRQLKSLAQFASGAHKTLNAVEHEENSRRAALSLMEDAVAARENLEKSNKELKESEAKLREADRRKDEFLATLAHELRNPIAPLRNAVEIMRRAGDNPASVAEARDMLYRQVRQLSRIVDDLIDVSRIVEKKIELRTERLLLGDVVETALETCRSLIEGCQHRLSVSLPNTPVYIEADAVRLAQILINLLNNAAKYTDPGGEIALTASVEAAKEKAKHGNPAVASQVVIRVRDNGIGIPGDLLPRVFDMFIQGDRSLERGRGGLGIGLTLVRSLVQMHGGAIEARSGGPGRGSEFVLRMPVVSKVSGVTAGPREQAATASPRRILVVDDNHDQAESLGMLLKLLGHEVQIAYDGPSAVELAAGFAPDVALVDIGLPGMNGYDVARRIRSQPGHSPVLLIAQTGWGQDDDRRRSQEAGFDHHMVKPVDIAALQTIVATAHAMHAHAGGR